KAQIGKVDVAVEERQIVLVRPLLDLSWVAVRTAVGVRLVAVAIVQELLVFALQFVVEDDPMNPYVVLVEPLRSPDVSGVQLRVVRQLARTRVPGIERLFRLVFWCAVTLEQLASASREGDQHRLPILVAVERRDRPNQLGGPQPVEVAVPQVSG